ncbi:MAG: VOC family protein [Candidatus Roizmanbacteria bacterium]|nr:VOC family protein [Candidatus Roizmanbacteria bacterium]
MKQQIEWIILVTDNYQESYIFYKDILEFHVEREVAREEFCQFSLQNCFLTIYGRRFVQQLIGKEYIGKSGGALYTLGESQDIDEQYKKLKRKGVRFIKNPCTQPWGQRTAYFTDPDGHIWEIQQWVNKVK